jgi:hypothetical protein
MWTGFVRHSDQAAQRNQVGLIAPPSSLAKLSYRHSAHLTVRKMCSNQDASAYDGPDEIMYIIYYYILGYFHKHGFVV